MENHNRHNKWETIPRNPKERKIFIILIYSSKFAFYTNLILAGRVYYDQKILNELGIGSLRRVNGTFVHPSD